MVRPDAMLHVIAVNTTHLDVLEDNCRPEWSNAVCTIGNIFGLIAAVMRFFELAPQMWKNYIRKSVHGVSALWASMTFTASLINLFFVFGSGLELPVYVEMEAIFQPTMEAFLLIQFFVYGKHYDPLRKTVFIIYCFTVWCSIIALEVLLEIQPYMQWAAIVLWSTEYIPQILLNIKRKSVTGLSKVGIAVNVKMRLVEFVANNVLAMPIQFVMLSFYSSVLACIIAIQSVVHSTPAVTHEANSIFTIGSGAPEADDTTATIAPREMIQISREEEADTCSVQTDINAFTECDRANLILDKGRSTKKSVWVYRFFLICGQGFSWRNCRDCLLVAFLSVALIAMSCTLLWNLGSIFFIFCPTSVVAIVSFGYVYYHIR